MKKLTLLIFLLALTSIYAQKWGLYTLYSVKGTNTAYLIDTNNAIYKTWTFATDKKTCFSTYLTRGDTLVRTVSYSGNVINDGPTSGEVQKVDWNGNVVWDYIYSSSTYVLHHDICPLPNGNVLMIALDVKTAAQGTQAGGSTSMVRNSDKILEVQPTGAATGTIVWEWDLWDHLCQNYDAAKDNYVSSILQNPQLININNNNSTDYFHMNGIDYNAALDQITFSSFTFSEIFVIDHSTTTAQAAGHTGGNSGHGGDIIYRWGNPAAYGASGTADFKVVHDAHWISADNPYFPNYLCGFNNTGGTGGKSCVDIIAPPYNGYNYSINLGSSYAPSTYAWRYTSSSTSTNEGNSQQLPNGNSLVCVSFVDSILEVNYSGSTLWSMKASGTVSKAYRYSKSFVRGPIAGASASSASVVSGTQITLYSSAVSVTETNPAYTYSWTSVPAGFTSSSQNPVLSPTATARYLVTITNTAIGCSDTASVTVTVTAPTDVELTEFNSKVQGEIVILNWKTATEKNNSGFEIQRRINSPEWTSIGWIKGAGNSSIVNNYSYSDKITNYAYANSIYYRIKQVDTDGNFKIYSTIEVNLNETPSGFSLFQNYPNPFNPSTIIKYSIPVNQHVTLIVYDILGREIEKLVNEEKTAGEYEVKFNGQNLASGVYIYKLTSGSFIQVKKMQLIK